MKWVCTAILFLAIAGCSDSPASVPRAAAPADKIAVAEGKHSAAFPSPQAESKAVAMMAVAETPGEIGSALAKAHPDRAKAMLAASKKALEATKATYEMGTNTLANLHLWSRHVVLAERALTQSKEQELAALIDYWKRSKQTYLKVRALYNTGSRGGEAERFAAAAYYLAEAELWLEAAGGTVPEEVD